MRLKTRFALFALLVCNAFRAQAAPSNIGYYRFPALHGDTIVFTAQGDLWKVSARGGNAQALTSHPGDETHAVISPDGTQVAFSASYEGPEELYVMPIDGGLPTRLTFRGGGPLACGWTPDGKIVYSTYAYATLPDRQMFILDPKTRAQTPIPLSQASEGVYDAKGDTLYFTRLPFQGSNTRRYQGGTAQNLWKYATGAPEAAPLTANYPGTSKAPMWWNNRVYFLSDRDGAMNVWTMNPNGGDLKQLTHHKDFDIQSPSLDKGRIVYQMGADLYLLDIAAAKETKLDITISSDLDQTREHWITEPMRYLSSASLSADGSRLALTSRGRVFVAPTVPGRLVEATRRPGVRYRDVLFAPEGKSIFAVADESGEMEWWQLPANGIGERRQITNGSQILPMGGSVSPDGKWIAYGDKNFDFWLLNVTDGKKTKIATSTTGAIDAPAWSPDSQWLAYSLPMQPFSRIMLYGLKDAKSVPITTERADSSNPVFSPDGKWLYFLSDRTFHSLVGAPWGPRQPEPFFPNQTKIYQLALTKGLRSPFLPNDELQTPPKSAEPPKGPPVVTIDMEGLAGRLREVPAPAGSYDNLTMNGGRLFFMNREMTPERRANLQTLDITNEKPEVKTLMGDVQNYLLSSDGKRLVVMKSGAFFIADAGAGPPMSLEKRVDLAGWTFSVEPREEWREIFADAWRMERDYFYDRHLHGVDWNAIRQKYFPLVERVRDRNELGDIEAQMIAELSALHMFVFGGDTRSGGENVSVAALGAEWSRDAAQGGYKIERIYQGDPDDPNSLSPLVLPEVAASVGDVVQAINGVDALSVPDVAALLRNQAGKQTLLRFREAATGKIRECVVMPINGNQFANLRYTDWEMSRRKKVEGAGKGDIGYIHLRAMGQGDMETWARDFYPIFMRSGLIIDVRHNGGGNIDSWILERLLRRAWFYWQPRVGEPYWNMQGAFRGHIVVLCDAHTGSDGEAFTEGVKRLNIGKVIGTRTWGGEIWLTMSNSLVDNGIASAAEFGVYGPEGKWLIEGHGVDPDIIVDNLPHATYLGEDAQLKAGIEYLQKEIREHPVPVPPAPAYPNKSGVVKR